MVRNSIAGLLVVAGVMVPSAALGDSVVFSVGNKIYTSFGSGSSWSAPQMAIVQNNPGNAGIVAIGQRSQGQFYAITTNGTFHSITGLGTASPTLGASLFDFTSTGIVPGQSGTNTISFDFFGPNNQYLRGSAGSYLVTLDMNNLTTSGFSSVNGGGSQLPGTARVGSNFYGVRNDGTSVSVNLVTGVQTVLGASGLGNMTLAGGSSNHAAYDKFFVTGAYNSNQSVVFGEIDTGTGLFDQRAVFSVGSGIIGGAGMGFVYIVPLPPAAWAGLGTLGCVVGLSVIRRRRATAV